MSNLAPSPSSSSSSHSSGNDNSNDQSDDSNAPPPRGSGSGSSSNRNGSSSPPPSQSSGGSRSTSPPSNSQDSSSSNSQGSSSSSAPPPSDSSLSPPPASPSRSSSNGGNSNSSPPPTPPSESSRNSGNSNSSPPPTRSSSPPSSPSSSSEGPPRTSGGSPSLPRSFPSPPQWSNNNDQSGSPPPTGGQSSPSPSPPPTPANHSVVFIPVISSHGPPGALPPPGLVAIAPAGVVGVMSSHLPGSTPAQGGTSGGMQAGSSGSTSSHGGANTSSSSAKQSPLESSRAVSGQLAAAIAGSAVTGFLFVVIAIFFIVWQRRKRTELVYHQDGNHYMRSGQFVGSNPPSGVLYLAPPGASAGFSYGPPGPGATDNLRGGGYYQSGSMDPPGSKSSFSYEELTSITSNFSRDNVIGEGGFGCVYKGWLADGKCVAVKQLKAGSGQGEREFQAEVEIISRVHHRHLVSLVGYCVAQHHRMLIYEFVPNGTLEHHLHGRGVRVMDWPTRSRIAICAAKGLAYLHEDCTLITRVFFKSRKNKILLIVCAITSKTEPLKKVGAGLYFFSLRKDLQL